MKSIKGTETEKNLLKAFAGESEARNRYTYFAGVAKKPVTSRSRPFSWKRPTMKRNTPKCSSNC